MPGSSYRPNPRIVGTFDPLSNLSKKQKEAVAPMLFKWRELAMESSFFFNLLRLQDGVIPTWATWSGCFWVRNLADQYREEMFTRPGEIHITLMPHLALPPGWHASTRHITEFACKRRYGYWVTETEWVPPSVIFGSGVWVKKEGAD